MSVSSSTEPVELMLGSCCEGHGVDPRLLALVGLGQFRPLDFIVGLLQSSAVDARKAY